MTPKIGWVLCFLSVAGTSYRSSLVTSASYKKRPPNKSNKILGEGLEPSTYCVLSSRHNQLDHPSLCVSVNMAVVLIQRFSRNDREHNDNECSR
jgi:hypothetical protein